MAEEGGDGAGGDRGSAGEVGFGGEADAFYAEEEGEIIVEAPGRVGGAHEGEDGVLD